MLTRLAAYLASQQKGKDRMARMQDYNIEDPNLMSVFPEYDGKTIKIPYRGFHIIVKIANFSLQKYMYDEIHILDDRSVHVTDRMVNIVQHYRIRPTGENLNKCFILIDKYIENLEKDKEKTNAT